MSVYVDGVMSKSALRIAFSVIALLFVMSGALEGQSGKQGAIPVTVLTDTVGLPAARSGPMIASLAMSRAFAGMFPRYFGLSPVRALRIARCGQANATFRNHAITLCAELAESVYEDAVHREAERFLDAHPDGALPDSAAVKEFNDRAYSSMYGVIHFFLLHEAGHAIIAEYELPVIGRDEDAADQFAAWFILSVRGSDKSVMSASDFLRVIGTAAGGTSAKKYGYVHPMSAERALNMVCWTAGSGAAVPDHLVELLPSSRALQCRDEFARIDRTWRGLLRQHLRS